MAIRPLKDGVIADFEVTEQMLRYFINKSSREALLAPARRRLRSVRRHRGREARGSRRPASRPAPASAYLIEEPMAAAIGAGLPVDEPTGSMVVDIGGGTTEVAVISLGGIVVAQSIRIAGDEFDDAIISHFKRAYKMAIGTQTAEKIKFEIGSAWPLAERGRAGTRPRPRLGAAEDDHAGIRRDQRGPRRAGQRHRRRGQGHAGPDAAGAGG